MEEEDIPKKSPAKIILPIILVLVIISALYFGISKYIYARHHEDTDDAQIDTDISPVLSRVAEYVNEIRFEENQHVNKGDTLVKLEDRDLLIKVQQSQAGIDNVQANVEVAKANLATAEANLAAASSGVETAKIRVWKASEDFKRYQNLIKDNAVTQQQFDAVKAEKLGADAQLETMNYQREFASMQVKAAQDQVTSAQSIISQRQADCDFAKLQLSYTSVIAPVSGIAAKKTFQSGQLVNAGTPLFAIVSDNDLYVIANFKETQLTKMKQGQPVEIEADAFPNTKIEGTVYSFSPVTGAKFSLLPPDNATGNFVKVVQRVPVKIKIKAAKEVMSMLKAGMSVKVSVKID